MLLDSRTAGLDPWAEMALMFASRAQQLAQVIVPALGEWPLGPVRPLHRLDRSLPGWRTTAWQRRGAASCIEVLCRGLVARPYDPDGLRRRSQREARTPAQPGGGRTAPIQTRTALSRKAMRSSPGCRTLFSPLPSANRSAWPWSMRGVRRKWSIRRSSALCESDCYCNYQPSRLQSQAGSAL